MKTPKQWQTEMESDLSDVAFALVQTDAITSEQQRWQDAIYEQLRLACPMANIDGKGCDSGDPLDFTLAEIGQAMAFKADEIESMKVKVTELTGLLEVTRHYRIGHQVPMEWFIKRDKAIGNPAVVSPNDELSDGPSKTK